MKTRKKAATIKSKYKTNNPYDIAEQMGIIVTFEPLGTLNGFYNVAYRQKFIHINERLSIDRARFVCAHELAHAILHSNLGNTQFWHNNTNLNCGKIENDANNFAVCLLINDDDIREYRTTENLSRVFGIDENIIKMSEICQG